MPELPEVLQRRLLAAMTVVPDFPKPGVQFRDITPLLLDPALFTATIEAMAERLQGVDALAGVDARGFVFAGAVAYRLRLPLALFRKGGKLPRQTVTAAYAKEYGTDNLFLHRDSLVAGQRVAVIDDVLATGGTAAAAEQILTQLGCRPSFLFLGEIAFLGGRAKLRTSEVQRLVEI